MRRLRSTLLLFATFAAAAPVPAQEWRAGAQFGRIASEATPTANANSVALSLSRYGVMDWIGVTAGVPLDEQPLWGVAAAWKRWQSAPSRGLGLDVTAHGFVQRHRESSESRIPIDPFDPQTASLSSHGAGGEAVAFGFAHVGAWRLEASGGVAAQSSTVADVASSAVLPVASVRVAHTQYALEGRQWFGDSAHASLGASAQLTTGAVDIWASGAQWLRGGQDEPEFAVGAAYSPMGRLRLEASFRTPAFDPLYGTTTQRTFSLGASVRLGSSTAVRAPVPARYENGRALIRIAAEDVRGTPSIAGDFTDWKPRAMTRDGGEWTFTVPLEPGVYHYAFVNDQGDWFVPESVPGRQDDGMGGHVAVLVVSG